MGRQPSTQLSRDPAYTPALAYRAFTPCYDRALELIGLGRTFKGQVAALLAVEPGESVLDLACGTGTLLAALAAEQPAASYTGVDPDPAVLATARRRLASGAAPVTLIQGYAQALPVPAARLDAVVSTLAFHHLPDVVKRQTLAEIRRVLRPGGRFLLVDFGRPRTPVFRLLLAVGGLFDGRANLRANLAGELPDYLADAASSPPKPPPPRPGDPVPAGPTRRPGTDGRAAAVATALGVQGVTVSAVQG